MLTPEQEQARMFGLGGSDAPVVLQLSPWKTPYELWSEKRAKLDGTAVSQFIRKLEENPAIEWGLRLESAVLDAFSDKTGIKLVARDVPLAHPEASFILGHADGMGEDENPVEAKTARSSDGWGETGSSDIPLHYEPQVQHYLGLCPKAAGAHVAVLIGGSDFRTYFVPRDNELIADLFEAEARFWNEHVLTGLPPDASTVATLMHRFRFDDGSKLEADSTLAQRVADLKEFAEAIGRLEEHVAETKSEIMNAMREAQTLTYQGRPIVTWKTAKAPTRLDGSALRAAHPEIYERFCKPGEASRRFLVK